MNTKEMNIRDRHLEPMNSEEWMRFLAQNEFTSEELCWIYCCAMEWRGLLTDPENLTMITKEMLDLGMDPNQLVTDELPDKDSGDLFYHTPMISATRYMDDRAAAGSLKLLLERGGDPNTVYSFEVSGAYDENVFMFYDEDEFINGPDLDSGSFYGLLLCAAYGGKCLNGYDPFTMLIDAPISIFKDHDKYWYEYEHHENDPGTMYIIEKATGRRVAKYH